MKNSNKINATRSTILQGVTNFGKIFIVNFSKPLGIILLFLFVVFMIYQNRESLSEMSNLDSPYGYFDDNYKVLVLNFHGDRDLASVDQKYESKLLERYKSIVDSLDYDISIESYEPFKFPHTSKEAKKIGKEKRADLVIWGNYMEMSESDSKIRIRHVLTKDIKIVDDSLNTEEELEKIKIDDEKFLNFFVLKERGLLSKVQKGNLSEIEFDSIFSLKRELIDGDSGMRLLQDLEDLGEGYLQKDIDYLINYTISYYYFEKEEYDNALKILRDLENLKKSPDACDEIVLNAIAQLYIRKNELDSALSTYNQLLNCNPNNGSALYTKGYIHYSKKEYLKAINNFNTLIELKPNFKRAYLMKTYAHTKRILRKSDILLTEDTKNIVDNLKKNKLFINYYLFNSLEQLFTHTSNNFDILFVNDNIGILSSSNFKKYLHSKNINIKSINTPLSSNSQISNLHQNEKPELILFFDSNNNLSFSFCNNFTNDNLFEEHLGFKLLDNINSISKGYPLKGSIPSNENDLIYWVKGFYEYKQGNYSNSIKHFEEIKSLSDYEVIKEQLAISHLKNCDSLASNQFFNSIDSSKYNSLNLQFYHALNENSLFDFLNTEYTKQNYNSPEVSILYFNHLLIALANDSNDSNTINRLLEKIDNVNSNPMSYFLQGLIKNELNNKEEANEQFKKCSDCFNNTSSFEFLDLICLLAQKKDSSSLYQDFTFQLIEKIENKFFKNLFKGSLYLLNEDFDNALVYLEKSKLFKNEIKDEELDIIRWIEKIGIKAYPNKLVKLINSDLSTNVKSLPYVLKAFCYFQLKKHELEPQKAADEINALRQDIPNSIIPDYYDTFLKINNDEVNTEKYLSNLVDDYPNNILPYIFRTGYYQFLPCEDSIRFERDVNKIFDLISDTSFTKLGLGILALERNKNNKAKLYLKEAYKENPRYSLVHLISSSLFFVVNDSVPNLSVMQSRYLNKYQDNISYFRKKYPENLHLNLGLDLSDVIVDIIEITSTFEKAEEIDLDINDGFIAFALANKYELRDVYKRLAFVFGEDGTEYDNWFFDFM